LVVDYEETCLRAGIAIAAAVSVRGTPRLLGRAGIVDLAEFDPATAPFPFIACAFAPERRRELAALALQRGLVAASALIDPTAIVASTVRVGEGTYVNAGAIVSAASLIGRNVLVNRAASLGHHTLLGDLCSIGPGATLAGNVHVAEGAVIGAGAVIQPDIRIGRAAIVAAGSVVRRHVPDGATVAGNPAVERRYDARRGSLYEADGE
jgi:sugar O-acyltransferase (sialic acid O-acetyltransferase NeuD family)